MIRALAVLVCVFCTPLLAQQRASQGWDRVQQLAPGSNLKIRLERRSTHCAFLRADDASLTCAGFLHGLGSGTTRTFARAEIKSIRGSRTGVSSVAGTAIGVGLGAGMGVGVNASQKSAEEDGQLVPAVFGLLGGLVGFTIGHYTDFLAGPVLYTAH